MTTPEDRSEARNWRFGRTTLAFAAALTIAMFGWQAYHLYESQQAVAKRDAGECPTRAVEAAYSAGERLDYLTEEIEHSFFLWGPNVADSPLQELGLRYDATDAELREALDQATRLSKGKVLAAVQQLEDARQPLSDHVGEVLLLATQGDADAAQTAITGTRFVGARADYTAALNDMWTASRQHLIDQLEREQRGEVISVSVALGLFGLAVGAWGLFIRQIRRGQTRLQDEERQRRRAEEELLQAQKMDALGLMAGGIAHDFNNLITAIWGSATSAKSQLDFGHPATTSLERIEDASEQANGVVRALLTFARRADSAKSPVEVGALIESTARILESMLPASVEVATDHPSGMLWVSGDATQLQQALMNLGLNAHEAMPGGGKVAFRAWHCSETPDGVARVVVEVTDTGEGIDPNVIDRVFEPFFTTRAPGQGTGLGLSIIHGIVTDHGGRIRVESVPGEGTSFVIDLPAIEAPVEGLEVPPPPSLTTHHRDELVLLVEDHQHVREIIAETLETAGFGVIQAGSGEEFLDRFRTAKEPIQLLIADVDIPPPSGVDCIKLLRREGVNIPAIVITGTPAPGLEETLEGMAYVLRKPFTMTRLAELAATLVEGAPV
jgi:signal transduction histidine kinase/CheY-like chemotaxis protein